MLFISFGNRRIVKRKITLKPTNTPKTEFERLGMEFGKTAKARAINEKFRGVRGNAKKTRQGARVAYHKALLGFLEEKGASTNVIGFAKQALEREKDGLRVLDSLV